MIEAGSPIPSVRVWLEPSTDGLLIDELVADGPILLLFYLYDWSST
jgi:hypothetical protein